MRPAAPVCFVTNSSFIILLDISFASCGENTTRTPPLSPFLKEPFPRPPASTCAFKTRFFVLRSEAIFSASAPDVATPNLGVGMPASLRKL
uniref:Putative secreted protein n=1 Tax=Anopheles triannulatus TaxID=58253 RepID=A0A2M4B119_9DIPT